MTEQKKGPGAVGAAAGAENIPTTAEEKEMNNTSMTDATDNREAVQRLFAEIAACPEGHVVILEPGDPFYEPEQPVRLKPVAEFGGRVQVGEFVDLAPVFDENGVRVEEPGADWWAGAFAEIGISDWHRWMRTPNAVLRVGDRLLVAAGSYRVAGTRVVDGVEVAEMITLAEQNRRTREAEAAWIAAHPDVSAATGWHDSVDVVDFAEGSDDGVELMFEKDLGPVRIVQAAYHRDGALRWSDEPTVVVDSGYREDLTVDGMRELASALMAAIPLVEEATA